jgi:hypothetical protein
MGAHSDSPKAAAVVQGVGGVFAILVASFYVMSATTTGEEPGRALLAAACWAPGIVALVLAFPLARGNASAVRASRWLALWYPVGPLLAMFFGPMFHGSLAFVVFAVVGAVGGATIFALTR